MAYQQPKTIPVPERVPEGFLLSVDISDRQKGIGLAIFGLLWTAFVGVMFVFLLREADYVGVAFLSLFLVIGVCLLGIGLLHLWRSLKLHPAELILPKYPLRLGETCPIYYRRRLRNGTFTQSGYVEARLICDEWVQYKQGTDTRTRTHSLYEVQLPRHTVVTGESQADYESKIEVAAEAPPTFLAKHNRVRWRLIVQLKVPGIPRTCESEFHLNVVPEMMVS